MSIIIPFLIFRSYSVFEVLLLAEFQLPQEKTPYYAFVGKALKCIQSAFCFFLIYMKTSK